MCSRGVTGGGSSSAPRGTMAMPRRGRAAAAAERLREEAGLGDAPGAQRVLAGGEAQRVHGYHQVAGVGGAPGAAAAPAVAVARGDRLALDHEAHVAAETAPAHAARRVERIAAREAGSVEAGRVGVEGRQAVLDLEPRRAAGGEDVRERALAGVAVQAAGGHVDATVRERRRKRRAAVRAEVAVHAGGGFEAPGRAPLLPVEPLRRDPHQGGESRSVGLAAEAAVAVVHQLERRLDAEDVRAAQTTPFDHSLPSRRAGEHRGAAGGRRRVPTGRPAGHRLDCDPCDARCCSWRCCWPRAPGPTARRSGPRPRTSRSRARTARSIRSRSTAKAPIVVSP